MAKRTTLNVSLTPKLAKFIRDQVKSGEYASSSEVVRRALSKLANEADEVARFWALIDEAERDVKAGHLVDGPEFMAELRRRTELRRQTRKSA